MRQRLLEATVDCLVEHGWSGTSTTLVSQRAGVSRGAQLHHFPTKDAPRPRGRRAPERAARARSCARRRAQLPTRQAAHARGRSRCSPTTSPARCSLPPSSSGSRRGPTRRCTRPSYRLEQRVGREAHRIAVDALGVDESRPRRARAGAGDPRPRPRARAGEHDHRRRRPPKPDPRRLGAHPRPGAEAEMSDLLDQVLDRPRRGGRRRSTSSSHRSTTPAGVRRPRRPAGTSPPRSRTSRGPTRSRCSPPPTRRPGTRSCCRRSPTRRASSTPRRSRARRPRRARSSPAGARRGRRCRRRCATTRPARRCRGSARR